VLPWLTHRHAPFGQPAELKCISIEAYTPEHAVLIFKKSKFHGAFASEPFSSHIGVARIFSGVHFFPEKVDNFFSRPQYTLQRLQLQNHPLPHSNSPPPTKKFPPKFDFLLRRHLGVHLQLIPIYYAPPPFFPFRGDSKTNCIPLATPMPTVDCWGIPALSDFQPSKLKSRLHHSVTIWQTKLSLNFTATSALSPTVENIACIYATARSR